jgi:hypothetical protein
MGEIVPHNFFRNAENPKMSNRLASTTMIRTAIRRASHQVLDDNPRMLGDPLAVGLVEGRVATKSLASRRPGLTRRRKNLESLG